MMTSSLTNPVKESFYSAEFRLNQSNIMYQFKLRRSSKEPLFAVVQEGSKALESIKEGDILEIRYHYLDEKIPSESRPTRIKSIIKDSSAGFKNHYVVALVPNTTDKSAESPTRLGTSQKQVA